MAKSISNHFLRDQPSDEGVRIHLLPGRVTLQFVVGDPPEGTVTSEFEYDDAKKLATRIWAAVKLARGELSILDTKDAN